MPNNIFPQTKSSIKQGAGWIILFVLSFILLEFALTGRMAIAASIAFMPDNVIYTGS